MKTVPLNLLMSGVLLTQLAADNTPIGEISSDSAIVHEGVRPTLRWQINHNPTSVIDYVIITPEGGIVAKRDMKVRVKILAADVQEFVSFWNGFEYTSYANYVSADSYIRSKNTWKKVFSGTQDSVDPSEVVWESELDKDEELVFAAKANYTSLDWVYSEQDGEKVIILKDGQTPPSLVTWDSQFSLGSHIAPYLDENNKIDIGPRDVIIAFELTGDPKNGNNGHGNNVDGYDSSNPGKKPGIDLSGDFDDEKKAITSGDNVDPLDFQDLVLLLTFEAN